LAGLGIALGGKAVEDAFKLGFDVFSAGFVAHVTTVAGSYKKGNMLIQNLSRTENSGEKYDDNYAELFNKSDYGEGKLERERERERERESKKRAGNGCCPHHFDL
jgi:hypothetical protein